MLEFFTCVHCLCSCDIYVPRLTSLAEKLPVGKSNVLLRGCIVRNTDFVDGIVVYAGV